MSGHQISDGSTLCLVWFYLVSAVDEYPKATRTHVINKAFGPKDHAFVRLFGCFEP